MAKGVKSLPSTRSVVSGFRPPAAAGQPAPTIIRPQLRIDGHLELLEGPALPEVGLQAVLAEPEGDVVGGQIEPVCAQPPALQLIGGQVAGRVGHPLLGGGWVLSPRAGGRGGPLTVAGKQR